MKLFKLFLVLIILITCGCTNNKEDYLIENYLKDFAYKTGIDYSDDYFNNLVLWNVINDEDKTILKNALTFDFLNSTINKLESIYIPYIEGNIDKEEANKWIDILCEKINNKIFKSEYHYKFQDEIVSDEFEDVYEEFHVSDTFELDLNECEIISASNDIINTKGTLYLSNTNGFNYKGYRISYSLLNGGLSFRISKTRDDSFHTYIDVDIRNIKPSFNWDYSNKKLNEAYLKLDFDSNLKFGVSLGKYLDYAFDFKNADKSNLLSLLDTILVKEKDEEDVVIPLCTIKTPIPNIPFVYLNLEVGIHIYASGKAEIIVTNSSTIGFEIKDNKFRLISDFDNDLDFQVGASFRSSLGLNVSISTLDYRLLDFEMDGGIKGKILSTVHLYDDEYELDESYSSLSDLTSEDENIKVCGDLSLSWLLDLKINTYKTLLYKLGLSKTISIFDDDDQIFGNLSHIENGQFVKRCTRKNKSLFKIVKKEINEDRIMLPKYSVVLKKEEIYVIEPSSLPKGYNIEDLRFLNGNDEVCIIDGNKIVAINPGSSKIKIMTNDNKYEIYLNVLVSYE